MPSSSRSGPHTKQVGKGCPVIQRSFPAATAAAASSGVDRLGQLADVHLGRRGPRPRACPRRSRAPRRRRAPPPSRSRAGAARAASPRRSPPRAPRPPGRRCSRRWRSPGGPLKRAGTITAAAYPPARGGRSRRSAGLDPVAEGLQRGVQLRGGERDLLQAGVGRGGEALDRADAARVRVHRQGQPLHDAQVATPGDRAAGGALLRAAAAARRLGPDGTDGVAAARQLPPRRRAAGRRARGAARRGGMRSSSATRAGSPPR